jgi:hypothetical protein
MNRLFKKSWKWVFLFVLASCKMNSRQQAQPNQEKKIQSQEVQDPSVMEKPAEVSQQFWDYYISCKKDVHIQQFRKIVDLYNSGELNVGEQIDAGAYENLKKYSKDYLGGKFCVAYVQEGEYGGEWIQLIFINKPDRVFKAWILHDKLVEFIDAEWPKEQIKKMQGDKEFLNTKYGF